MLVLRGILYNVTIMRYTKLVRDKIPEILDQKGVPYDLRTATDEEYKAELIRKLLEEAEEFKGGEIEELADVMEVMEALKALPEYAEVESVRLEKKEERGAFERRIILSGEKD